MYAAPCNSFEISNLVMFMKFTVIDIIVLLNAASLSFHNLLVSVGQWPVQRAIDRIKELLWFNVVCSDKKSRLDQGSNL